jgi:hypothetical protein
MVLLTNVKAYYITYPNWFLAVILLTDLVKLKITSHARLR